MDTNEVKLETIKRRILDEGDRLIKTRSQNGRYFVKLEHGEEIWFEDSFKSVVDDAINEAIHGDRIEQNGRYDHINGRYDNSIADHLT